MATRKLWVLRVSLGALDGRLLRVNRCGSDWGRKLLLAILASITLLTGRPQSARAQIAGTITGVVADESGAVVPDTEVTITDTKTGVVARTVKTNSSGIYVAEPVLVGTYQVAAQAPGFGRVVRSGIVLNVADRLSINFTLKVSQVKETIEVTSAAPLVRTETGEQSQSVSERQIQEIPILGRNFMDLQKLVPGASKTGADEIGKGFFGERGYAINGLSSSYTGYALDGVQNTDMGNQRSTLTNPGPDMLTEFKVLTSNYSAKYGTAGGANLLAVTKSGTRGFHGAAFDYFRNDKLNANDFFLNRSGVRRSPLRYNNFGYSLGGPIYIPGHYNTDKSKTFFFWSQEWIRQRGATTILAATPTASMRNGDFKGVATLRNPTNPQTGQPLTDASGSPCINGSLINPNCINKSMQLLFNQNFPLPNASGFQNFVQGATSGQNWREESIRVDQNVSEKVKVFVRFTHDSWIENDPLVTWSADSFPSIQSRFNIPSRNLIAKVTTVLNPKMVNEISYNYASNYPPSKTVAMQILGARTRPTGFVAKSVFGENTFNLVPDIRFTGGFGGISALWGPWWAHHNISSLSDDFSVQIGSHSIGIGGTGQYSITPVLSQISPGSQGGFSFDGRFTGHPIADAVLGLPASYTELQGRRQPFYNYHQFEVYFQDDWKVNRRLTLNLGVRWFALPQVYSNAISAFDPGRFDPAKAPTVKENGTIVPGSGDLLDGIIVSSGFDPAKVPPTEGGSIALGSEGLRNIIASKQKGVPRSLVPNHKNTFAPRFGFAWDPFGTGKTAIRGGYGVGYFRIEGNDVYRLVGNPPFSQQASFFNPPFEDPGAGAAAPLRPRSLGSLDPIFENPTAQNWSFSIERELPSNSRLSVAYAGSRGTHLEQVVDVNQPLPTQGFDFDPRIACTPTTPVPCTQRISTDFVRPFSGFSNISAVAPIGNSIYHSLQVSFQKRNTHGLTMGVAYTVSKAIALSSGNSLGSVPQNSLNIKADRGLAAFDRAQILNINYLYDLPFFRGAKGLTGAALKGWELTGVITLEGGFALTPGFSSSTQGLARRPDRVTNEPIEGLGTAESFFNRNAFVPAKFGHFGNAGRGIIRGPGLAQFDLGVFKAFQVTEYAKIQFRTEMVNAFNHTNFNTIDTTFGSGSFGQAVSAHQPRNIQFALKVLF